MATIVKRVYYSKNVKPTPCAEPDCKVVMQKGDKMKTWQLQYEGPSITNYSRQKYCEKCEKYYTRKPPEINLPEDPVLDLSLPDK